MPSRRELKLEMPIKTKPSLLPSPDFCKFCGSTGHSDFQASVARSVQTILDEEAEVTLKFLGALSIYFKDKQELQNDDGEWCDEQDGDFDTAGEHVEDLWAPEQVTANVRDDIEMQQVKKRKASAPRVGFIIREASNPTIPTTLLTLPPKVHRRLFDILKNERLTSLRLGLTCKTFYKLHWSRHGKLSIQDLDDRPTDISTDEYISQLSDPVEMMHCITHFFPKNTFYSYKIGKWVTLERRIELRDMRVQDKLENVKSLQVSKYNEASLSAIWKKVYGDRLLGYMEDDSDDDIAACKK